MWDGMLLLAWGCLSHTHGWSVTTVSQPSPHSSTAWQQGEESNTAGTTGQVMVTGNGTCSSWDHQSLPCWLYTVVSTQTLPQLPTAPAASTFVPVLAQAGRDTTSLQLLFSTSMAPGVSKKLQKAAIFQTLSIGGRGKASNAVRMVRGSHSQSYWRVRRTERIKDRTFFNSKNNAEENIRGSKYAGDSLILYRLLCLVSQQNR